ncbi:hypothetical protein PEDI_14080 [Persicobacter diffluens]|uniref:DUF6089 domain-containing protein n=2 Tax=Persicobacter diffluens TaxID=981 RepID=A0AAN4VXI6_9BACT|nr:hypothetical protein PEDI_14080 [Persicobacter diffluens]
MVINFKIFRFFEKTFIIWTLIISSNSYFNTIASNIHSMKLKYPLLILIFSCLSILEVTAQSFYARGADRKFVFTAGTGIANYYGDLANDGQFWVQPNLTVGLRYRFWDRLSIAGDITYFTLRGDDAKANDIGRKNRNLNFMSHNVEFATTLHVDLFPVPSRFYARRAVNPYFFIGIGGVTVNPTTKLEGTKYNLRNIETEPGQSYGAVTYTIPMGFGCSFRVSPFVNIAVDGGYRFTGTDYLDDVSGPRYMPFDNESLESQLSDRTREILPNDPDRWPSNRPEESQVRGNPDNNDGYFLMNFRVEYFFSFGSGGKMHKRKRSTRRYKPKKRRRR